MDKHYKKGEIEPLDVIFDWELDFCLGNVLKYINRHKFKGTPKEDIEKAINYLNIYYKKKFNLNE